MERVYHLPILLADTESTDGTFAELFIYEDKPPYPQFIFILIFCQN